MGVFLIFMLSNLHISFVSNAKYYIFLKAMNKIWKTFFALLCYGNKQLQKSQWLHKVNAYFLFILHVPCRAGAALLRLISMSPNWPRIHSAKCFRTTESVGEGRETKCTLAFNCFLTEMIHVTSASISLVMKITWPYPH